MERFFLPEQVTALCAALEEQGFAAYVVGGAVRDLLLGRPPEDYDVCSAALPEQVAELFPKTVPTGIAHGTVTVLMEGLPVEVTTFRGEDRYSDGRHPDSVRFGVTLVEDLARRDFTIGAMACRPKDGTLEDPFGGRRDLERRLVRCVGEPARRFREDALRILRAARFAAQLGFSIHPDTAAAMEECAPLTARLSGERVKAELQKLLLSPAPEQVELLLRIGALNHLFTPRIPAEWSALREAAADPVHRWRAFCTLTGFPPAALPMERALRRGIEHPEEERLAALAVTGGRLYALGLRGKEISAARRRLADHVERHPEDNTEERLLALWREWQER